MAEIAAAAEQEDVDVIGLSILSGAHQLICQKLFAELARRGLEVPVVVGGIIPTADFAALHQAGVAAVFGPESPIEAITSKVRQVALGQSSRSDLLMANAEPRSSP